MRRFLAVSAGVVLTLPALSGSAAAAPAQPVCGTPIVTDVKLKADLTCTDVVRVDGNGITVNLAGHTINASITVVGSDVTVKRGSITATRANAVFIEGDNALLQNLTISGATDFAVEAGRDTTIRRSTFVGNAFAVGQFFSDGLLVENSVFQGNTVGVSVQNGSDAVVRRSKFVGNEIGVQVRDEELHGADGTQILGNSFADNGIGVRIKGSADANNTLVDGNTIKDSAASGILVTSEGIAFLHFPRGGALGTTIRDNTVTRSGGTPLDVSACSADEVPCSTTADDGITVLAPADIAATMVLSNNRVTHSAGYGIEAPDVTDGGLNTAKKNGAGGCVGVTCR